MESLRPHLLTPRKSQKYRPHLRWRTILIFFKVKIRAFPYRKRELTEKRASLRSIGKSWPRREIHDEVAGCPALRSSDDVASSIANEDTFYSQYLGAVCSVLNLYPIEQSSSNTPAATPARVYVLVMMHNMLPAPYAVFKDDCLRCPIFPGSTALTSFQTSLRRCLRARS